MCSIWLSPVLGKISGIAYLRHRRKLFLSFWEFVGARYRCQVSLYLHNIGIMSSRAVTYMRRRPSARYPRAMQNYKKKRYLPRKYLYPSPKLIVGMPLMAGGVFTEIRYATKFTIASNTSTPYAIDYRQMRLNGIYDPDAQAGGHQPQAFDQYMALYDRFQVVSARMILSSVLPFNCPTNTAGVVGACTWAICVSRSSSLLSNQDTILEQAGRLNIQTDLNTPQKDRKLVSPWYSIADVLGISKKNYMGEDVYCGSSVGDPTSGVFITAYMLGTSFLLAYTQEMHITMEYKVLFSSRAQIGGS